jgi:Family of unknown function (DUF6459)
MSPATTLSEQYERIQWDRSHRAPSIEEMFGWQHTPDPSLPDPSPLIANLALGAVEALAGVREPEQIGRWLMPAVYQQLLRKHTAVSRRQTEARRRANRPTFSLGSTRITRVADGVAEGCATVSNGSRVRAVAIRLEAIDHRWRATELHIL